MKIRLLKKLRKNAALLIYADIKYDDKHGVYYHTIYKHGMMGDDVFIYGLSPEKSYDIYGTWSLRHYKSIVYRDLKLYRRRYILGEIYKRRAKILTKKLEQSAKYIGWS